MSKKNAKIRIVLWSLVAIILSMFLFDNIFSRKNHFSISPFKFFSINISNNDGSNNLKHIQEYTANINNASDIEFNLGVDEIIIKSTSEDKIKIIEKSNYKLEKDEKLKISDGNKVVNISREGKKINVGENRYRYLEVYLPESYGKNLSIKSSVGDVVIENGLNLGRLSINQGVGDLKIKGEMSLNELIASSNTGDMNIGKLNTESYDIKGKIGDISIKSIAGKGNIKVTTGEISCGIESMSGDVYISSKTGDVDLDVKNNLNCNLDAKCKVGDIDIDIKLNDYNGSKNNVNAVIGEKANYNLKVDSSVGDIEINEM